VNRTLVLAVMISATLAAAKDGETGVLGMGDPLELGAVAGTWAPQWVDNPKSDPAAQAATLVGIRLHGGAYTHQTLLGNGGGVEANAVVGYAIADKGFFWGQLDALANVGLFNHAFGPFIARLHALVGFGFSLWSGTSLAGGGRLALGIDDAFSLEATWLTLPTVNLTFAHRAQANLVIKPAQLALGAELNFGSANVGQTHFSIVGTACWRPKFD
jgi:hypothetical protein